jgi:hypothetical protein
MGERRVGESFTSTFDGSSSSSFFVLFPMAAHVFFLLHVFMQAEKRISSVDTLLFIFWWCEESMTVSYLLTAVFYTCRCTHDARQRSIYY